MMYLALSYDHRIVDGREAVTFLVRVKECWRIRRGWCWIVTAVMADGCLCSVRSSRQPAMTIESMS